MSSLQQQVSDNLAKYRQERSRFIELIRRQEALAAQDPDGYRRRVVAYASLGYLYVFGVVLFLLAILAGLAFLIIFSSGARVLLLKLGIVLIPIIYYVVRSLFVKIEKPTGPRVSPRDAPKLWAEVDEMAQKLGAPKIDEIVLDMDMNAAAAQVPRIGLLGFYRNYLLLGLPLMIALPKDEMKSVIAHEFGHFSGQHGRTGGWIYRLNAAFEGIRANLARHGGSMLFSPFFNWFQPRFDAVSFALRRQNEYAADAAAARLAGADAAAMALMRLGFLSEMMDKAVWDRMTERSREQSEAPRDAYSNLEKRLEEAGQTVEIETHLSRSLKSTTSYDDTHPSLTDRLRALGQLPEGSRDEVIAKLRKPVAESAADAYLGGYLPKAVEAFNQEFYNQWKDGWKDMYDGHRKAIEELAELERKADEGELSWSEKLELAYLTLRKKDAAMALPMFQRFLVEKPNDPDVLYGLGEALLELGEGEGETHLRESFRLNLEYLPAATQLIASYRAKYGNPDDIDQLREEFYENLQAAQVVEREKSNLRVGDTFVESSYDQIQRDKLAEQLMALTDVKRAWLVAKVIPMDVTQRTEVLIIEPTKTMLSSSDRNSRVVDKVLQEVAFPTAIMVFAPDQIKPWTNRLSQVPNSLIVAK